MAKVSKAVKQKRKDFAKTKLKVGKTKGQADNHTDTSFKAAKIVLPKQSVNNAVHMSALQEQGEAVSGDAGQYLETAAKDRAVMDRLLGLLQHKAADTRKDALVSLASFLAAKHKHQAISSVVLTPIMAKLVPMILDEDRPVRRQLLQTFEKIQSLHQHTMQQAGRESGGTANDSENILSRYATDLLLYITSAMTHIVAPIRADSTKFLGLLLDCNNNTTDIFLDDRSKATSPVLQRLVSAADAGSGNNDQGGVGLAKLIDCFAMLLGFSNSGSKGTGASSATTARVATTTGIKTTVQHLCVLHVILEAALLPDTIASRTALTYRCLADGTFARVCEGKADVTMTNGLFVIASRVLSAHASGTLNLFAPGSALGRVAAADATDSDEGGEQSAARLIVLRHAVDLVKYLVELFADGVNMYLELCVPCLHIISALAPLLPDEQDTGARRSVMSSTQREFAKLMKKSEMKLKNGMDQLTDRGGSGIVQVAKAYQQVLAALEPAEVMEQ